MLSGLLFLKDYFTILAKFCGLFGAFFGFLTSFLPML